MEMKLNLEKEFADWALIELIDRQLHLAIVSLYRTLHYTTQHYTFNNWANARAHDHDKNNTQCQAGKEPDWDWDAKWLSSSDSSDSVCESSMGGLQGKAEGGRGVLPAYANVTKAK